MGELIKLVSKNKPDDRSVVVKSCENCAYRKGVFFSSWKCQGSMYYCSVERAYPLFCGRDFERWQPKQKTIQKIKKLLSID